MRATTSSTGTATTAATPRKIGARMIRQIMPSPRNRPATHRNTTTARVDSVRTPKADPLLRPSPGSSAVPMPISPGSPTNSSAVGVSWWSASTRYASTASTSTARLPAQAHAAAGRPPGRASGGLAGSVAGSAVVPHSGQHTRTRPAPAPAPGSKRSPRAG